MNWLSPLNPTKTKWDRRDQRRIGKCCRKRIMINGTVYSSISAAAKAIGRSPTRILYMLKAGLAHEHKP